MNIFYFAYDHHKPTGGQKAVYRHVDILNRNGFSAFVLHMQEGFKLGWFANDTRTIGPTRFRGIYNVNEDIIVLPEDLGRNILTYPGKKVIVNQGPYLGFYTYGFEEPKPYPYLDPSVVAVLVKSGHSADYLHFAFPSIKTIRVFDGVDSSRFPFKSIKDKKRIIGAAPNKNTMELTQVYNILKARSQQKLNRLEDYEWAFLENKSEDDVAKVLGNSQIFIFLSTIEGFGILPLEAMLSGCLVAAYDIPPLTEYLSQENSLLLKRGDVTGVVTAVERAIESIVASPEKCDAMTQKARASAEAFSLAREEKSVIEAWQEIVKTVG
jgi:hypothetical protein